MPRDYSVAVIEIRSGSAADAPAIARVRRDSWHAAYAGIIAAPIIDRVTATGGAAADPPPYRRTLVAEAGEHPAVIGYASFGPERAVASPSSAPTSPPDGRPGRPPAPYPLTPAGRAGLVGELYALYVTPAWWSAGVGGALTDRVLTSLKSDGYRRAVLWVLADNSRARRFYERIGFAPDGGTNTIAGLGGVLELRYSRDL
jgi:ribosomal protein S18 acetylase RimI-like enzyme